jgi:hypothetical protein|tara:strand:- start:19535 stop:21196 length:1662 start_codon:yes stop_codon:yes gene_type:complete
MKVFLSKLIYFFKYKINKGLPNWKTILRNKLNYKVTIKNKKKILIATLSGGHKVASTIESMIAAGLNLKGHDVSTLICDEFLDLCILKTLKNKKKIINDKLNKKLCKSCFSCAKKSYANLKIKRILLSDYLSDNDRLKIQEVLNQKSLDTDKIKKFQINGINLGEQVIANVCRYYALSDFTREDDHKEIVIRYFHSALLSYYSISKMIEENNFDKIVTNHGFYVPQGILFEIAKKNKIDVVTWTSGARKNSFIFCHNNIYNKDFVNEPKYLWDKLKLNYAKEKIIDNYLESKVFGLQDYIYHKSNVDLDINRYFENIKLDNSKPLIGLTTNVIWDAQLHYDDTIFSSMMEWVYETIKFFSKNQNYNLIIRVHPTETKSDRPAREKVKEEINKKIKKYLTKNIFIVDSIENISTYSILDKCNLVLTYGTKLDIEYAARGYPIIVSGEAMTRKKGFVIEPKDKTEYFNILEKLEKIEMLDAEKNLLAKKFAFHYFFKRSLVFSSLIEKPYSFPPFYINEDFFENVTENKDKDLNLILDCIINKKPFISNKYENIN